MTTTITTPTTTTTRPGGTSVNVRRALTLAAGAAIGAIATVGVVQVLDDPAPAADSGSVTAVYDTYAGASELQGYARINGLTGLSPASLAAVQAEQDALSALAEYGETHGLSGLSPASLAPISDG